MAGTNTDTQTTDPQSAPEAAAEPSQSRGADGRFVASTPEPAQADAAVAEPTPREGVDVAEPAAETVATPAESPAIALEDDFDARFDRAYAAATAEDAPATDTPNPAPTQPKEPEPADPVAKDYDGMDEESYTALKRVQMLPPPEQWQGLTLKQRYQRVAAAERMRADADRAFQQQQKQQQAPQGNADLQGKQPAASEPAPTPAEPAGKVTLPERLEKVIAKVQAEFGEDLATAYREGFELMQSELDAKTQQIAEATRKDVEARQQELQRQQEQAQVTHIRAVEDATLDRLSAKFPKLADAAVRDEVRKQAEAWAVAQAADGLRFNTIDEAIKASIEDVAQSKFFKEIQAQERARLAKSRQRSLAGSVERGTPQSPRQRGAVKDPIDAAYDALKAAHERGEVGEPAVARVRQLLSA